MELTTETEVTINLDVFCSNCGNSLDGHLNYRNNLEIEPCEICSKEEYDRGFINGHDQGLQDANDTDYLANSTIDNVTKD